MTMLDELMVATQHIIGWEEGAAELARLRRIEVAYRNEFLHYDAHKSEQWCSFCDHWTHLEATLRHTATCDVAIHLGLPREKGDGE